MLRQRTQEILDTLHKLDADQKVELALRDALSNLSKARAGMRPDHPAKDDIEQAKECVVRQLVQTRNRNRQTRESLDSQASQLDAHAWWDGSDSADRDTSN